MRLWQDRPSAGKQKTESKSKKVKGREQAENMKQFKIWFKSIAVAFSMYSKIPMPRFVWKSEDMKYHLCFFPWIGALIGVLEVVWYQISCSWQTSFLSLCVMAAIPLLVTGGFHVDGFLDTCDALHSYQSMEKKREILKDPHIGAFAVLSLLTAVLLGLGFLSVISEPEAILAFAFSFFLSRCLSGLSVVLWKSAHDGMLQTSALTADKKCVAVVLAVQLLIGSVALFVLTGWYGLAALGCLFCSFLYYRWMSHKQFGGITGDLAGYFVTTSELAVVIGLGVLSLL